LLPDLEEDFLGKVLGELGQLDETRDELSERILVEVEQGRESIRITRGEPG
jgi:hypothetical protein